MAALELLPGSPAGQPLFAQEPQPWGAEGRQVLQAVAEALVHVRRPASRLLDGADFPQVGTADWGRMNRKRAELIRKKIRGELSEEERELLEALQRRSLEEPERGPRKAVFTKVDGTWKLTEPVQAEAKHTELENLVNAVARLRAASLVAEKPTEAQLKTYGLDKPSARWHFQEDGKDVLALELGRREKNGGRCYARLEKGDLVFVLDPALTGKLFAEYRKRDAWNPPLDAAQAERLTYRRGETAFTLEKVGTAWQLEGKPSAKVNAEAVSDALAAIAGLRAERFVVDKGADLKLYGLAPPELVIEVQTPAGTKVLHVGRPEGESKRYYARVPAKDQSDVFVIGEADAARIVRDQPAFVQTTAKAEKPGQ